MTEAAFGAYVNRDQSTVSHWLTAGVLTRGADAQTWIREIIDHLAEQAAGRRGSGGKLDLCQERAALAKSQREKIDFDLHRLRGEFVPARLVREWWDRMGSMVRTRILSLPSRYKSTHPRLSAREIYELDDLIREQVMSMKTTFTPGHYRRRVAGVLARRLVARLFF